eukprot:CAMPEP_0119140968 /NCGR_PEP_ID=MMETSP1310-20130426/30140_1 /TAXON_ID=464262 /ORGANISM="Genus nov. species nov., Strain RCC2339" /LENGTH=564 /DNA_ID=CAMNT_0007132375 /DNA_START=132 /DNA_END=1826 /DNA_ORIENTATION=+
MSSARETWFDMGQQEEVVRVLEWDTVSGREVPGWLGGGSLYRMVPAQYVFRNSSGLPNARYRHYFDGLAMVLRFEVLANASAVSFSNRFLRTKAYETNNGNGRLNYVAFGTPANAGLLPVGPVPLPGAGKNTPRHPVNEIPASLLSRDPCALTFSSVRVHFDGPAVDAGSGDRSSDRVGLGYSDNINVNFAKIGETVVTTSDTTLSVVFDEQTLDTLGYVNYSDAVGLPEPTDLYGIPSSAHPLYNRFASSPDPPGTLYNYAAYFGPVCRINLLKIYPTEDRRAPVRREQFGKYKVPCRKMPYMHSFGLTERFMVLSYIPEYFEEFNLIGQYPIAYSMHYEPSANTTWLIFDRNTGELVRTLESPPFFMFHFINAFEDADTNSVVVDVYTYPDDDVKDASYLTPLQHCPERWRRGFTAGQYSRFRLPLSSEAAAFIPGTVATSAKLELPWINQDAVGGRSHRFVYGLGVRDEGTSDYFDAIVKTDLETDSQLVWSREGCYPSEAVFVASPDAGAGEDDGVLMAVVYDSPARASFLLVLDASNMSTIATAPCPFPITQNIHGIFL